VKREKAISCDDPVFLFPGSGKIQYYTIHTIYTIQYGVSHITFPKYNTLFFHYDVVNGVEVVEKVVNEYIGIMI